MTNYENRLAAAMGEDYDFDHDHLTKEDTDAFIAILKAMPNYKAFNNSNGQWTYHRAFDPDQDLMADIQVFNENGIGSFAYTGSEEIENKAPW